MRIPNPEQNLLETLLEDSWATHMRRSVISSVIYILLILIFLILPVQILHYFTQKFEVAFVPFRPPCAYFWTNGQILLEVTAVYLVVYYAIEPFRATLRKYLDHYLPIVCRSLGLETFLLPIKAENLKKLEGSGNIDEVLEIQEKTKLLGPRKLSPRKTPNFVGIRMISLIFLVWFAVLLVNVSLLSLITLAMYLPYLAFRCEGEIIHGPYGLLGTVLVAWLSWHRREKISNFCNQFDGLPEKFLVYIVVPIFNTSLLSFVVGSHPTRAYRNLMQVIWSNIYFTIAFLFLALGMLLSAVSVVCKRKLHDMRPWFTSHILLPFFLCIFVKSIIGRDARSDDVTTESILEMAILHAETFYVCQRWLLTFVKDYIGGIWSNIFLFCMYDIVKTQALPRLSLLHDSLRDKKYLVGKKLQEFKKD